MTDETTAYRWTIGSGGWVRVDDDAVPGPVYLRLAEDRGRWFIADLYVDGRGREITPGHIRELPFLPSVVADITRDVDARETLSRSTSYPGPDLSRLASWFARQGFSRGVRFGWVADCWRSQISGSGVSQPPMGPDPDYAELEGLRRRPPVPDPSGGLTDAFLLDVAALYRWYLAQRKPPAVEMGKLMRVKTRTVHNWMYKARDRQLIPQTTPGRAS